MADPTPAQISPQTGLQGVWHRMRALLIPSLTGDQADLLARIRFPCC